MKKVWKKRAVVGAVLLFVCAAVYMNWRYAGSLEDTSKVLGESTLVSGEKTGENDANGQQMGNENDYSARHASAASRHATTPSACSRTRPRTKTPTNPC